MSALLDPVLVLLASAFFCLLWGMAATHKALDRALFAQQLGDYRVLPPALLPLAVVLLPLLEAGTALGWLNATSRPLAALASAALFSLYGAAIGHNLRAGRDSIDCGCGGEAGQSIRWALVARNAVLALVALPFALGLHANGRAMGWIDWVSVDAGALALIGLYLIGNQIWANFPPQRALR
jgi:hypothetical protein